MLLLSKHSNLLFLHHNTSGNDVKMIECTLWGHDTTCNLLYLQSDMMQFCKSHGLYWNIFNHCPPPHFSRGAMVIYIYGEFKTSLSWYKINECSDTIIIQRTVFFWRSVITGQMSRYTFWTKVWTAPGLKVYSWVLRRIYIIKTGIMFFPNPIEQADFHPPNRTCLSPSSTYNSYAHEPSYRESFRAYMSRERGQQRRERIHSAIRCSFRDILTLLDAIHKYNGLDLKLAILIKINELHESWLRFH